MYFAATNKLTELSVFFDNTDPNYQKSLAGISNLMNSMFIKQKSLSSPDQITLNTPTVSLSDKITKFCLNKCFSNTATNITLNYKHLTTHYLWLNYIFMKSNNEINMLNVCRIFTNCQNFIIQMPDNFICNDSFCKSLTEDLKNINDEILIRFKWNTTSNNINNKNDLEKYNKQFKQVVFDCKDYDDSKQNNDPSPYNFKQVNFDIDPNKIHNTKQIYAQQCPSLGSGDQQKDLFTVLAVARYGKIPLLPFLIGAFTRDRLKHYIKHKQLIQIQSWSRSYITYITKTEKYQNQLEEAMATFSHSYCGVMRLPVLLTIDDNIEAFAQYIVETSTFIQTLFKATRITLPFQIDLLIIPNKMHNSMNNTVIGNIKNKLIESNVIYQYQMLNSTETLRRKFHRMYERLATDYNSYNSDDDDINDDDDDDDDDINDDNDIKIDNNSLDCRRRVCIVIDRRYNNKSLKDHVYMYMPPSGNQIPKDNVPEWFFESSCQCILPSKRRNITAKTAGGNVFCLSFHIIEKWDIKCYLYFNGQMMRFLPSDIVDLFPQLFKDTNQNKIFIQKEQISKEKQTKIKLLDLRFLHFRQQIKPTKI